MENRIISINDTKHNKIIFMQFIVDIEKECKCIKFQNIADNRRVAYGKYSNKSNF